jgi:hypothetical protein
VHKGPSSARCDTRCRRRGALTSAVLPVVQPIEKAWAKLKDILRRLPTLSRDAFDDAVAFAMTEISNADVRAWTTFAGYSLGSI